MLISVSNKKWKEHLKGGRADGKTPSEFNQDDVNIGSKVQREHTIDLDTQKEITIDHLEDDKEYYDKLILSGIADEQDAIDLYDKLKTDDEKRAIIKKLEDRLKKNKEKLGMKENRLLKFDDFVNESESISAKSIKENLNSAATKFNNKIFSICNLTKSEFNLTSYEIYHLLTNFLKEYIEENKI